MKRLFILLVILSLGLLNTPVVHADADQVVGLTVNGRMQVLDPPPIMRNGRTLVPLRHLAELLGAEVSWDDATQRITRKRDQNQVTLWIGSPDALLNNRQLKLDSTPVLVDGRTMVPLRFISEALLYQEYRTLGRPKGTHPNGEAWA